MVPFDAFFTPGISWLAIGIQMRLAINLHAQHGMDIVTSENYQALNPSASCETYGKFWKNKKITEVLGKMGPPNHWET